MRSARRRAQAGEPEVFEYLYRLHSRRVYALCLRMLKADGLGFAQLIARIGQGWRRNFRHIALRVQAGIAPETPPLLWNGSCPR
jgi:hypothetical protein